MIGVISNYNAAKNIENAALYHRECSNKILRKCKLKNNSECSNK
jgi:hypothetical protein